MARSGGESGRGARAAGEGRGGSGFYSPCSRRAFRDGSAAGRGKTACRPARTDDGRGEGGGGFARRARNGGGLREPGAVAFVLIAAAGATAERRARSRRRAREGAGDRDQRAR